MQLTSLVFRVLRLAAAMLVIVTGIALPDVAWAQATLPTATPTAPPSSNAPTSIDVTAPSYAPGELLVGMHQNMVQSSQAATPFSTAAALGVTVVDTMDLSGPDDDLVVAHVTTPPGHEYETAALLAQQPGVVYVEPNFYVYAADMGPGEHRQVAPDSADPSADPSAAPPISSVTESNAHVDAPFVVSDPLYAQQQWNMQRVNAARGWQLALETGGFATPADDIVVAVIDSGIDTSHPDFAGRLLPGYNYVDDVNPDPFVFTPGPMRDGCGHGTHVAGIIAAGLNDAIGVAGIAPMVKIDPRRVLEIDRGYCTGNIADVASAIISATADGADIISMSLQISANPSTLEAAVEYAGAQGVFLVAAAGNSLNSIRPVSYPGAYSEVMAVAALGYDDLRASYSNVGPEIEIAAPGGEAYTDKVLSTWSNQALNQCGSSDTLITLGPPDAPYSYCTRSGTSQATPMVAGAGALLMALRPELTAAEVRSILRETAAPLGEAPLFVGSGKLDVEAAVMRLLSGDLQLTPATQTTEIVSSTKPITLTLRLDNPSLEPVNFRVGLSTSVAPMFSASGSVTPTVPTVRLTSGDVDVQSGSVAYASPGFITVKMTPTFGWSGVITATVDVTGTRADGSSVNRSAALIVSFFQPLSQWFFPLISENMRGRVMAASSATSAWLAPASETDRVTYAMTDTSEVIVAMPFDFPLGDASYSSLRLFSDGFLAVPDAAPSGVTWPFTPTDNQCMPAVNYPLQGIYGWWADLNPGVSTGGARISSFPLGSDRFVIEFRKIAATNVAEPYRVSFQMVLSESGDVRFNYGDVPTFIGAPERVTIGVEGTDSRFYSLIACATPTRIIGWLPRDGQSLEVKAADVY